MSDFGIPTWIALGSDATFTKKYVLKYVMAGAGGVHRFQVSGRGQTEGEQPNPPPTETNPVERTSWELDLKPGESEVIPLMKDRGARFLLTLASEDVKGGRVQVIISKVSKRVPIVIRHDREEAPVPVEQVPVPAVTPSAGNGSSPEQHNVGDDRENCGREDCPDCGPPRTMKKANTAMRKILRMGIGELARKAATQPIEADRIATELGITSDHDLLPTVLGLLAKAAAHVGP